MTNAVMLDASWKWLPKTAIFVNVHAGFRDVPGRADAQDVVISAARHRGSSRSADREDVRPARPRLYERVLLVGREHGRHLGQHLRGSVVHGAADDVEPGGARISPRVRELRDQQLLLQRDGVRVVRAADCKPAGAGSVRALHLQELPGSVRPARRLARTDNFFQVGATLDYFVRNWIYAGVGYALLVNRSDVRLDGSGGRRLHEAAGVRSRSDSRIRTFAS